jgi:hypothetical protein
MVVTPPVHADSGTCTVKQDDQASKMLSRSTSLSGIYKVAGLFPGCMEGGGISEEVSDDVVVRLSHHWQSALEELQKRRADYRFISFVLRHIDATTDSDDL